MTTSDSSHASDAGRLKAILDSAVDAIVTIDAAGVIGSASAAITRILGYTESELIGRNVKMLMHESEGRRHDGYMARYIETGERRIIGIGREVVARHRDGHSVSVHLSVGEFEHDGRRYFTGILADLSRQRHAEERLAQEEALLGSIFESVSDAFVVTDPEWTVRLVNASFTRMFGHESSHIIGRPFMELCGGEDHGTDPMHTLCPQGQSTPSPVLVTFGRANGQSFPGETVCSPVRGRDGTRLGYVALIRDVARELKRESAMRTMARLEAIGQLTGGIAHDFNNLLTVIVGNLELLERRLEKVAAGDAELVLLREVLDAADKGAGLTDRLLSFARRKRLDSRTLELDGLLGSMVDLLRRTLGSNIVLRVDAEPGLWQPRADPGLVETAVVNLVINARDAMPSGGRITIGIRNVMLDSGAAEISPGLAVGSYVVLSVTDTGQGMTPEVAERAFEPFFTTKEVGKGSGLGLASVYGFARQSGGHATIYSEIGKGTTVSIYLPRAPQGDAAARAMPGLPVVPSGEGRLVLVVEDDPSVRRLTVMRLAELGYRVEAVENAEAAQTALASGLEPACIFTDYMMPGTLSGLDLARIVRGRHPHIAVLLTTGYAKGLVEASELDGLGLNVLRKPYRQAELAAAMHEAIALQLIDRRDGQKE